VLAGAQGLPPDSVGLVRANPTFMLAYMIGLNHEMGSELLWRGFPTDQRGTYFRCFWDRSGHDAAVAPGQPMDEGQPVDIDALHSLSADRALLGDAQGTAGNQLTLVIRGELLRRFPNTWITAEPAIFQNGQRKPVAKRVKAPLFAGSLGGDTRFMAFDLTLAEARGSETDPGWFIVFREPPTELRFGLDEPPAAGEGTVPGSVDDLHWGHVLDPGGRLQYASPTRAPLPDHSPFRESVRLDGRDAFPVTWATNGAHVARCFMQWPVKVALHASALLPPDSTAV
ncbi:MAG: hypothetical protein ACREXK_10885, partial [Gammaproteobacteria bacterium]